MTMDSRQKHVLIVDDEQVVLDALSKRCQLLGLDVHTAPSVMEAAGVLRAPDLTIDLLLVDQGLPGAAGLTLCEMVRADDRWSDVPVILLSEQDEEDVQQRCRALHVSLVLKGIDTWSALRSMICKMLDIRQPAVETTETCRLYMTGQPQQEHTVLVVDDDPGVVRVLQRHLEAGGYRVVSAPSGREAYWLALDHRPELVILDYKMPDGSGNTFLGKLKSNRLTSHIPVIFLSGMGDMGIQRDLLSLGAECWIDKPFDSNELMAVVGRYVPNKSSAAALCGQRSTGD